MKKKAAVIFFVLSAFLLTNSQTFAQAFDDGSNVISIGFGLPPSKRVFEDFDFRQNYYDYRLRNYGTGVLKYEHGLHKYFGLGLNLEYSATKQTYKYADQSDPNDYKYNVERKNKIIGGFLRFNGHFPVGQKLDFYGGAGLGYLYTLSLRTDSNPSVVDTKKKETVLDFDYQLTLGVRFMIKDHIGMFFEIGRATTVCQLGLAFKF